ncbi:MAG: Trm112 family protein [Chloroflexi bacterium]|nr:Trm112 family protein [Chloroflexota bacterium]
MDAFGASGVTLPDAPPKLGGEVAQELLDILACPDDKEPVKREGNYLVCARCHRHYPIRDGIPVMLIDEALTAEQAAAQPA